jgi:hypothetical protein
MLVSSARLKNPAIPPAIDEVILRALRADVATRYQRAEDLLSDLFAARDTLVKRAPAAASPAIATITPPRAPIQPPHPPVLKTPLPARPRTRDLGANRFCWHCRKPLPARADRCPFCGETQ